MTEQDWKQVRTELDGLLPGACEPEGQPALKQPQTEVRWADEVSILKHIAEALQLDEIGQT